MFVIIYEKNSEQPLGYFKTREDAVQHLLSEGYEPTEYLSDYYVVIDEDGFTDDRAEIVEFQEDDIYSRQMVREHV